ncbi:hypothetical protein [Deinococcus sp. PESE-13]
MNEDFTMVLQGGSVPARFVTLGGGERGVEVEGVAFPYVTDEVPHGIRALNDDQTRKMSELRQRCQVTSEAAVLPFDIDEAPRREESVPEESVHEESGHED